MMSKRQFKSQASSGRLGGFGGFGSSAFGAGSSSVLSYVQELPDYSAVSDPNVVVALKNLSKKDSTTKAKGVEDLQTSLAGTEGDVENAIIEIWVRQYPRLSIDNARRVRQLAHQYTGQLSVKCGKRIAKQLPRLVGPWLAGTFDSDKSVSKAAEEALSMVFPTAEKIHGLRKTFQESILEYSRDAVLNETVDTLSDERSVSVDDAKATYARVVSTGILVISSLLDTLPAEELAKQKHVYKSVLSNKNLWKFVSHEDSSVRKSLHRIVQLCLQQEPDLIEANLKTVSTAYIYKALASDQTGSSLSFVRTLDTLTASFPSIWTTAYTGKEPAVLRLQQCLKCGSYAGPAGYWDVMTTLLRKLPTEILPTQHNDIANLLRAARDGVSKKEERFNVLASWPVYFVLVDIVTRSAPEEDVNTILEAFVMPLVNQYLYPSEDQARWTISGPKPASLVSRIGAISYLPPLLEHHWPLLAAKLVEIAKASRPEQSKDFEKSQKEVAMTGERWAELQREFFVNRDNFPGSLHAIFVLANTTILRECISMLESRNGKPWGAAAIIEQQLRKCGSSLLQDEAYRHVLVDFVTQVLPTLFAGPSQRHLVRCLFALRDESTFDELVEATLSSVLNGNHQGNDVDQGTIRALQALLPSNAPIPAVAVAQNNALLQEFIKRKATWSDEAGRTLFLDLLKLGAVLQSTSDAVLSDLMQSLSLEGPQLEAGLSVIEQLARTNEPIVRAFMSTAEGEAMLPKVIQLKDSASDMATDTASVLADLLTSSFAETSSETKHGLILQNLETVSHSSLPIESVLELATHAFGAETDTQVVQGALPGIGVWRQSILAAATVPKASLALLSPLGGAIHLVKPAESALVPAYDSDGLSQAMRIAIYYANVLRNISMSTLPDVASILALLNICVLMSEDGTSITGANELWRADQSRNLEHEVMDFVSDANELLRTYWASTDQNKPLANLFSAFDTISSEHRDSTLGYYAGLAAAKAHENVFELHGCTTAQSKASEDELRAKRASKNFLALVSFIVGFAQPLTGSQYLARMCNEAVADLTQLELESNELKALEQLVLLNTILHTQSDIVDTIAKSRLIFLVKHNTPWLKSDAPLAIKAEVCKSLVLLLPAMADMYGEHWSQIISTLVSFWNTAADASHATAASEGAILVSNATLKLYAALRKLSRDEESNDDVVEALKDNDAQLRDGLITCLKAANGISDEQHQPLMATNELLARQFLQLPSQPLKDAEDLFPLLYAPSQAILRTSFELLHKHIPSAQEQVSLDAALTTQKVALPDELLSLIMQAPEMGALEDDAFETTIPLTLQGYLHGWRLVFDHFRGSSFRVKGDYADQLKEGGYLSGLLALTFDMLGLNSGRPVDASNFNVQEYTPGMEASPEKEVQALLTHLYYLSLSHLPSLVKNYLNNEIRSRQAPKTIETWTAKYISPLIIEQSLTEVSRWAEKTVSNDPDYEAMSVKVSMRGKEVHVAYEIDDQAIAMKIVLPEAYPLQIAKTEGINRVAVTEQKWRGWLMNCQGTITFSNGSIIDALSSWRRNVAGALKGHVECAICYSIVNEAKEMPTKRCATCRNTFHSACLFRWFKSSNSSTCPLCRQPYHYT